MATSSQGYGQAVPDETAGAVGPAATGGSLADRNGALIRHFVEVGVNGADTGVIDRFLSPGFTIVHNVRASALTGPAAFHEVCDGFLAAFPDLQVTLRDVVAAGDRVAADMIVGGTNTGEWLGHPATGRRVTYRAMALATLANDRLTHLTILDDYASLLQQLGWIVMPEVSRH